MKELKVVQKKQKKLSKKKGDESDDLAYDREESGWDSTHEQHGGKETCSVTMHSKLG